MLNDQGEPGKEPKPCSILSDVTCTRADQVVAWIDEPTGEIKKRRLEHGSQEVKEFYVQFPRGTVVGIEATFPAYWFERLMGELGHELWVGDAARIRASEVRYQKTDARDAEHILDLLRTNRFPRIWVPSLEERDLRQLLVHRMKQVRARTQVKNQLHALAISQGVCRKGKLWSVKGRNELEGLALLPWAARRRKELLEWLDRLDEQIRELDRAVEEAGREREEVALLRTHPGVGMVVGLAFALTVGPIERFRNSRKLVSLCLSGCFSKPQAVVYRRAAPSISENLARVPIDARERRGLPEISGSVPLAGGFCLSAMREPEFLRNRESPALAMHSLSVSSLPDGRDDSA